MMSGDFIKNTYKIEGEPDYYLRKGSKIYLFENKDVFLKSEIKASNDPQMVRDTINDKLVTQKAGIPQIINNVIKLLKNNISFDNIPNRKKIIYPIMIVHNYEFTIPNFNIYLKNIFMEELSKKIDLTKYNSIVKDLTIIHIDTLLFFQFSLKEKKFILSKMIDEYHNYNKYPFYYRTNEELVKMVSQGEYSFGDFFINSKLKNPYKAIREESMKWNALFRKISK